MNGNIITHPTTFCQQEKSAPAVDLLDRPLAGLYTDRIILKTPADKSRVIRAGYKSAEVTIDRWLDCHCSGYVFVPGTMRPYFDPYRKAHLYTHDESLWHGTDFTVIDLDNEASNPVLDPTDFTYAEPNAPDFLYAAVESVSSMQGKNSARWHGFVLFARTITTREEYDAILVGLSAQLEYMTGAGRQPAQPVYGNAREGHYVEIFESVLSESVMSELAETGYQRFPNWRASKPQAREKQYSRGYGGKTRKAQADYTIVKDPKLRQFLKDYNVVIYEGARFETSRHAEIYYTPCPFAADHSTHFDGATDAFITVNASDGKWGFGCFHAHCVDAHRDWNQFRQAVTCPIRAVLKTNNIKPKSVEFEAEGRVYRGLTCPSCQTLGDAVYLISEFRSVFVCEKCAPVSFDTYQSQLGGAA